MSTELPVATRHRRDMTEKLLKVTLNPNTHKHTHTEKRAARFVTGNYIYETGRMTGILEQLKWESLKKKGGEIVES